LPPFEDFFSFLNLTVVSTYLVASTGETFAAILPGFLQLISTVIIANTADQIKIIGLKDI